MIARASLVTAFVLLASAPLHSQRADSLHMQQPDTARNEKDLLLIALSLGGLGMCCQDEVYFTFGLQVTPITHERLAPDVSVAIALLGPLLEFRLNGALPYTARRGEVLVPSAGLSLAAGLRGQGRELDVRAGLNAGLALALLGSGGSGARGALYVHYLPPGRLRTTVELGLADTGRLRRERLPDE